ncbi:MAG: sensor signal transduction histidine kinase [Herbinix sp.]|jgi:PAS domain S-box-containing protein|nr:sensor signal transduction histidine kinase [Herbinix sp.]
MVPRDNISDIEWKYRLMLENSFEMILFFDDQGKIVDCNLTAKTELGYEDDIFDKTIFDIFQKTLFKGADYDTIIREYIKKPGETVAYRKNQTCFPVELMIKIIQTDRNIVGVCTARNITCKNDMIREMRAIQNELKNANKFQTNFFANITHELRTPVNGILGLTGNLLDTELSYGQLDMINIIRNCCLNMSALINDLLDCSKISSGKLELEQREFDFFKFINQIIAFNRNSINEKGLKLLVNVATDIPKMVIGDEFRLSQILNNLFSNAIKFTSVGQIALEVVKTFQSEQEVELFFILMDTGIGIGDEDKDKLFQSFMQADGTITRRFGGTGLGLSICKELVELMNGSISVNSEVSKGSTFSFSVRLKISTSGNDTNPMSISSDDINIIHDRKIPFMNNKTIGSLPEIDYIGKILNEANLSKPFSDEIRFMQDEQGKCCMEECITNLKFQVDKLNLCIEMENWYKAESFAETISKMIPKDHKGLWRLGFQLVLSVRKEDVVKSKELLQEIKAILTEVS